jgi:serine O-acetyltransferase
MGFFADAKRDIQHHIDGPFHLVPRPLTFLRVLRALIEPECHVVLAYRLYARLFTAGLTTCSYLLYLAAKGLMRCDIAREAVIGPGLRVTHPFDVVIGPDVRMGSDVVLFNGVTLGNRLSRGCWTGMPTVGDSVLIGTGAKILGPVTIGSHARIGANAVVLVSVPEGGTAVGNPARVIPAKTPASTPAVDPAGTGSPADPGAERRGA